MESRKAHIFGTGLIGASVGLGLRRAGWDVAGWDHSPSALEAAADRGAVDVRLGSPETDGADLVVLAGPPSVVVAQLTELETGTLVTDVAGVKAPIVDAARHLDHFVGGHPMAGGETTGASMASPSLFHGATWVLTEDGASPADLDTVSSVVESLGANPVVMTALQHDMAVARVSHLPHILAATLMNLNSREAEELAGGGFRDLTRVAAGDPKMWLDILSINSEALNEAIDDLKASLDVWRDGDGGDLEQLLETAKSKRIALGEHDTQIRVVLIDEPGEIARVGHALETSRVDVRDLQLRHGEHGGGGVLTISVRQDGRRPLVDALVAEGFEVQAN